MLYLVVEFASRSLKIGELDGDVVWITWQEFVERHLGDLMETNATMDFPVRPPLAEGVQIARPFGNEGHLGEDWNVAPGNEDLGEPVYSPGDGWVSLAMDFEGAWGKVVTVIYKVEEQGRVHYVEMMFAHLDAIYVEPFTLIPRGKLIGVMGNCGGLYAAHLHWEVRTELGLGLGGGYGEEDMLKSYRSGSGFISALRKEEGRYRFLAMEDWEMWGSD